MRLKHVYLSLLCFLSVTIIYGCGAHSMFSLATAIRENDTERAKQILKNENASKFVNYAHIHSAVIKRQIEIVEALLDAGVDPDLPDTGLRGVDYWTPLMQASNSGYPDICKLLIERGAKVNASNEEGWTPLILATKKNIKSLGAIDMKTYPTPMDKLETAKLLLNNGANLNNVTKLGTPLLSAVQQNFIEMVKLLVERGADVNLQNENGTTPLIKACFNEFFEIAKYLVENNADINRSDKEGFTPLMFAAGKGNEKLSEYLIDRSADINSENRDGITALFLAASGSYEESTKLLLMREAKFSVVDKYPYETAKSHKFIVEQNLERVDDKNKIIKFYTIAADYFKKAPFDLEKKSQKLVNLKVKVPRRRLGALDAHLRFNPYFESLGILSEDIDFSLVRCPNNSAQIAIAHGLAYGFDDLKIKIIQAEFKRKEVESNKMATECYAIASCYKNHSSENEIMTCVKSAKE
jgi:ankyrin repeat protein